MRKILAVLLLLCVLLTSIFFVACDKAKEEGQTTTETQQNNTTTPGTTTPAADTTTQQQSQDNTQTPSSNETPAFSGSVSEALALMKTAGTIQYEANTSDYGTFLTTVTYDGLTINNDNSHGKYIGVFINTDDEHLIDLYGTCDSVQYGNETFNYSGVGVDAIPYSAGLKVLIAFTVDAGNWHYTAEKGQVLLFTLPDKVEKVTLD